MPRKQAASQESVLDLTEAGSSSSSQSMITSSSQSVKGKRKQSELTQIDVNSPDFKRKVSDMVRYILFADRKKTGMKRAEIVKNVLPDNSRIFNKVFEEACLKINQVFGLDVVSMETEDGRSRGYILVNALDDEIINHADNDFMQSKNSEPKHFGLLLIILSMIFMIDGHLTEANLWYSLRKVGVRKDRKHRLFGDVDKLINQEFVRHHYLIRTKEQGPEGPTFHYNFGPRSNKEITKRKVLTFVSEVYGFEDITKWKVQYETVLRDENRGEQDDEAMDTQEA